MIPVIVYRVYADGRPDELVRGADIVGTPLASFSKILATGNKTGGLQRLLRRGIGQRAGFGGFAGDPGIGDRNREEGEVERPAAAAARAHFPRGAEGARSEDACDRQSSLAAGAALLWSQQAGAWRGADPELQAMRDEIERSRQMSLPNLEPPYFVQYVIDRRHELQRDGESRRAAFAAASTTVPLAGSAACAWATTSSTTRTIRGGGFNFGARYDLGRFPLEDSLRHPAALPLADDRFGVQIGGGSDFAQTRRPAQS